jgi:hypothetical protein
VVAATDDRSAHPALCLVVVEGMRASSTKRISLGQLPSVWAAALPLESDVSVTIDEL